MLNVNELIGFGAAPKPSFAFCNAYPSTVDGATHSFLSSDIGPASPSRLVVVSVASRSVAVPQLNTVTIGGIAAAIVADGGVDTTGRRSIWAARVPAEATADIVLSYGASVESASIGVWALYDLHSDVPYLDLGFTATAPATYTLAATDLQSDSIVISKATTVVAVASVTWTTTNMAEDFEVSQESTLHHTGASLQIDNQAALSIVVTPSNTTGTEYCILAAWR